MAKRHQRSYRPVVTFTYWLNWRKMSGDETMLDPNLSPVAREAAIESIVKNRLLIFHIINYWSHFLVTVLVYLLALHLTKRFWTAAAIGLLFGVHPVGVESVNEHHRPGRYFRVDHGDRRAVAVHPFHAVGRRVEDSVAGGSLAAHAVRCVQQRECGLRPARVRTVRPGLPLATGLDAELVLGSDQEIFLLVCDRLGRDVPADLRDVVARYFVFAAATPPETPFLDNPIRGVNRFAGEITALQVLVRLWGILIFPNQLSCDYSFNQVPTFGYLSTRMNDTMGLLAALLVVCVFAWAIYLWFRERKAASFFMLFFFVAFLPTSNILITIGSIMAERFLYLPMIGFVGALVLAIEWVVHRARFAVQPDDAPPIAELAVPAGPRRHLRSSRRCPPIVAVDRAVDLPRHRGPVRRSNVHAQLRLAERSDVVDRRQGCLADQLPVVSVVRVRAV